MNDLEKEVIDLGLRVTRLEELITGYKKYIESLLAALQVRRHIENGLEVK